MHKIILYENSKGECEVRDFIRSLRSQSYKNKNAKVNFTKVVAYIDILEEYGSRIGAPVTKHIEGELWELRPLRYRIMYAHLENEQIILLHHFLKKTNKTPKREIEKAMRELKDYRRRQTNEHMERTQKRT